MGLFDFLTGDADPMGKANKYLDKIPGTVKEYLDPAFQRGERAGGALEDALGSMMGDPSAFINELMKNYTASDAYKFKQGQMSDIAASTAAAGGMRGSPWEQKQQQQLTQGLLSEDMQDWLKNVLGVQQSGLQGEMGLYGIGTQAGSSLADSLANVLGSKAQMAYKAEQEKANFLPDFLGQIGKGIGAGMGLGGFGIPI